MKVRFSASGHGTKIYNFNSREAMMVDVAGTAADLGSDIIHDYGNEIVVCDCDGCEAARWEII